MQLLIGAVIGCVALGILALVANLLFEGAIVEAFDRFRSFLTRAADRESLADGRVSCGLRAVEGRVYNIGTEWSTGSAVLSPARLVFTPTTGIVGLRTISVTSVGRSSPSEAGDSVIRLGTPNGDLYWRMSTSEAEHASALVSSAAKS